MKKLQTLVMLLFTISILTSCSKDDDKKTIPKEDFLPGYLLTSGFIQASQNAVNDQTYETGLEFTPLVEGKITALKVKLPDVSAALRITIWDKEAATAIRTETVNLTSINVLTTFEIEELSLVKNKKYAITFNTNDFYARKKSDESDATYPITSGNIRIERFLIAATTAQVYPSGTYLYVYAGDLSFDFQPAE